MAWENLRAEVAETFADLDPMGLLEARLFNTYEARKAARRLEWWQRKPRGFRKQLSAAELRAYTYVWGVEYRKLNAGAIDPPSQLWLDFYPEERAKHPGMTAKLCALMRAQLVRDAKQSRLELLLFGAGGRK